MEEEAKRRRYKRWEEAGEDAIRADMESGGYRLVGGSPEVRRLAQHWLNEKQKARAARGEMRQVTNERRESWRYFWSTLLAIIGIVVAVILWYFSG
ncbi:hypothetical protein [Lentisalinibacter salinarum]|uniref:hypothetical protein n=1 Tax=Lentisalinibacter salinarum TaxID=2992239 RepID=UPI003865DCFC